ncbi:MAG: glycosyltransferase [Planctomycetota bacterium]|nr:glycosyltransferase [Planctomycetota bacterium]MDA1212101.1 glycosyltransferase [Planctomycetota bacterium]
MKNNSHALRLLFFSNAFPNPIAPNKGIFNRGLIRALAAEHPLRVVSPISWWDEFVARRRHKKRVNRRHIQLVDGVRTSYPRFYYPPKTLRSHYDLFLNWSTRTELEQVIAQFRPQAILSYWTHPDGTVAVETARRHHIPSIVMVGGSDVLILAENASRRRVIMSTLQQADAVIAVSDDISQKLQDQGISPDRLHVVKRGVDSHVFHPAPMNDARRQLGVPFDVPLLVTVGRLVSVKGLSDLLTAAHLLHQRGVVPKISIIGDGPLRQELERQRDRLGLADVVQFVGAQNQEQLANWYRAANYVIHPSLSEGIPNVLLEAMQCGSRFIASQVGGIPEIADPNFDRLVPAGDPTALANAIEEQLQIPLYPGERWFHPQTWEHSADQIVSIIRQCGLDRTRLHTTTSDSVTHTIEADESERMTLQPASAI